MNDLLANYRLLLRRVDELCRSIEERFRDRIVCRRGCDACCRHLSIFPVEAAFLSRAARELPSAEQTRILGQASRADVAAPCPLLADGECLLYHARPLICRTHGLPLLLGGSDEAGRRIDFCPLNFQGLESLPASGIIDLDRLNTALAAINAVFVAAAGRGISPDKRFTLAESILSKWE